MNIIVVAQTFPLNPKDGTAHFMYDFCVGLTHAGAKVTVLVPFHPKLRPSSFGPLRVIPFRYTFPESLHLLGYGRTLVNNQSFRWYVPLLIIPYVLCATLALLRLTKTQKPDIISSHWVLPNGLITAIGCSLTRTPFTISLPGTDVYVARINPLYRLLAQYALDRASVVITNSALLLRDLGIKGHIIPYGVVPNTGKRIQNVSPIVAAAGRKAVNKNFQLLLAIDPSTEIISGLSIDAFRQKLLSVDIFVAPSIRDEQGNLDDGNVVVLEAMAAGCAVIASDLPGYRYIIKHNENGLLVPVKNRKALTLAIQKLKRSPTLRTRLGQNARRTIQSQLSHHHIALRYLSLFRRAITT